MYHELFAALGSDASSEDSVQYWVARFASGDTSWEGISGAGRPLTGLAEPLRLFLDNYPFATMPMLSRHSNVSATTVKEILACDLRLRKLTRRWVPPPTSDPQNVKRVEASTELLHILNELQVDSFDGIATGDESWFQYLYESSALCVKSPHDITPRTRPGIGLKKTMFTIFFTHRKLLIVEDLPKGQKYNQDYFISEILPELAREKMRYKWRKQGGTLTPKAS
jgi:hypothetical protein